MRPLLLLITSLNAQALTLEQAESSVRQAVEGLPQAFARAEESPWREALLAPLSDEPLSGVADPAEAARLRMAHWKARAEALRRPADEAKSEYWSLDARIEEHAGEGGDPERLAALIIAKGKAGRRSSELGAMLGAALALHDEAFADLKHLTGGDQTEAQRRNSKQLGYRRLMSRGHLVGARLPPRHPVLTREQAARAAEQAVANARALLDSLDAAAPERLVRAALAGEGSETVDNLRKAARLKHEYWSACMDGLRDAPRSVDPRANTLRFNVCRELSEDALRDRGYVDGWTPPGQWRERKRRMLRFLVEAGPLPSL